MPDKSDESPAHRIFLVKTKTTGSIQILVQTSESMEKCKEIFDEIIAKHDIEKGKK